MLRARSKALALLLGLPVGLAHAADVEPRYPAEVRLVLRPETLAETYYFGSGPGRAPLNPSAKIPVGEQARNAFGASVRRLFTAPSAETTATLEVSIEEADVGLGSDGWFAYVNYELALREASGAVAGRWRLRGEGGIHGYGSRAVPRAFAEAAEYAAATLEANLETFEGIPAWLRSLGIEPREAPPGPPRLSPPPPIVVKPRTDRVVFLELGGGILGADGGAQSSAVGVRLGRSGKWVLAQLVADYWPVEFVATPPRAWGSSIAEVRVLAVGPDLALRRLLGRSIEVHAGLGARLLSGTAKTEYEPLSAPGTVVRGNARVLRLAGGLFGAVRYVGLVPRTAIRYRVGLEARRAFGATLEVPELGSEVEAARFGATLVLGIELPAGGSRRQR